MARHKRRGPKGTGQPDPSKDRSDHDSARGTKALASINLSRHDPTTEAFELSVKEMNEGSDRVAAILGAALVESELLQLLIHSLKDRSVEKALLTDRGAPLSTFSAMTLAARAFGLINAKMAAEIDIIRSVRNDFAHTLLSIDFDRPEIAARCQKLPDRISFAAKELGSDTRTGLAPSRTRFEGACWYVALALLQATTKILDEESAALENQAFLNQLIAPGTESGSDNGKG